MNSGRGFGPNAVFIIVLAELHDRHRAGISEADVGNLRLEIAYRFPPAVRISDKRVVLPCSRIDQPQVAGVPPRISGRTIEATLPGRLVLIRKICAIRMQLAWLGDPML